MAAQTLSAKELAQKCGTDARTVRKFLRKHLPEDQQPGQGGRYQFSAAEAQKLVKAYGNWAKGEVKEKPKAEKKEPEKKPAKAKASTKKAAAAAPPAEAEVEEIDLEDLEPSDEDIEEEDTDED